MDNLTIARVVVAAANVLTPTKFEAIAPEDLVDWVHEIRTDGEVVTSIFYSEAQADIAINTARACLAVGEVAAAELQGVIDHERLEIRGQALGSAIAHAKGAEAPWRGDELIALADTFEGYLLNGVVKGE